MKQLKQLVRAYNGCSLILRIAAGLAVGAVLGLAVPGASWLSIFGDLFVGALKAIAPILVFVLIMSALVQSSKGMNRRFGLVLLLYVVSTFLAALTGVVGSYLFPQKLALADIPDVTSAPSGIGEVIHNLLMNIVANPVASLVDANYIGILLWAVVVGLALKSVATESTKAVLSNLSDAVSQVVRWIINLAPFGIMGLVFNTVSTNGLGIFTTYGKLLLLLVGCMAFVALVVDPLIAFVCLRRNPYPLVFRCLRESGITAFFTRSSAANIPVNMALCERLGLDRETYSVSIPLGATINMDGAAVTISVMTLAAANTVGIAVDFPSALVLSLLATMAACGASGVAGGSLLLIPMACSLFEISNDVAMQVVGVGFIIGVIQDSVETALNSSGDVLFAAISEYTHWKREGKELPYFLGGKRKMDI